MNEKNGAFHAESPVLLFSTKPVKAARRKSTKVFQGGQITLQRFHNFLQGMQRKVCNAFIHLCNRCILFWGSLYKYITLHW